MKKFLLLLSFISFSFLAFSQCGDLFFSEYVEGYANNKALEIYNPTGAAINLGGYSIARFSNGATTAASPSETPAYIVELPSAMLEPYDVFVVVIDKQDTSLWNSQFDKPVWNGYNVVDTLFDEVTGEPILDRDGNVRTGPQYLDAGNGANAIFGSEYNEIYDLAGKADAFLCPSYATNRAMYFNGNDAMVLLKGNELAPDGSNIVDVIGVIGEDPETSIMNDAWVSPEGFWLTKDRSLIRQSSVVSGNNDLNKVVAAAGGSFEGEGWDSWFKNTFCFLGVHACDCDPNAPTQITTTDCGFDPADFTSTKDFNQVEFKMYPNPLTANDLTLVGEESIKRIQIFNLMGQQIFTQNFEGNNQLIQVQLPASIKDFLFVKVEFENKAISIQKLVKQ